MSVATSAAAAVGVLGWPLALLAAALGAVAGWYAHKLGEAAREKALDAYHREQIHVVDKARDRARDETAEVEDRLRRLRAEHERCAPELDRLRTKLADESEQAASAAKRVGGTSRKLERAEGELARANELLEATRVELRRKAEQLAAANNGNGSRRIAQLTGELATLRETYASCGEESDRLRRRIDELERRLRRHEPVWLMAKPDGPKDDLQSIRGLGPVLERKLNGLGVFHFKQLAGMSDEDVGWLASRLNVVAGRIERDGWIAQARRQLRDAGS